MKFLTAEHIADFKINFNTEKRILSKHHNGELSRTRLLNNDILVTIKGRIGNVAIVENLRGNVNLNQDVALLRLTPEIHPWYIVGFLNSSIGKTLIEQICTGQINPFLGFGNLKQIQIPIFDAKFMNEIGERIKEKTHSAHKASAESKELLELAKTGVEKAIEQDEKTAINWMKQQLKNLGISINLEDATYEYRSN
ncbi:MAG: hypothetical protein F6K16_30155 [Symploca sp. SIO2B6]|nr:hypothetical protein [Symploca sp. SIO2B6]